MRCRKEPAEEITRFLDRKTAVTGELRFYGRVRIDALSRMVEAEENEKANAASTKLEGVDETYRSS